MNCKVINLYILLIISQYSQADIPSPSYLEMVKDMLKLHSPQKKNHRSLQISPDDIELPRDTFVQTVPEQLELFTDILRERPLYQKTKQMSEKEREACCLANGWTPVRFAIVQQNIPATETLLRAGFKATEDDFHVAELLLRDPHKPRLTVQKQRFLASLYDHVQEKSDAFIKSHIQDVDSMKRGLHDSKGATNWTPEALFIKAAEKKDIAQMNALVTTHRANPNKPYFSLDALEVSAIHCSPEVTREAIKLGAVVTQRHLEHALLRKEAIKASMDDPCEAYAGYPEDLRNINRVIEILATHTSTPTISAEVASVLGFLRSSSK